MIKKNKRPIINEYGLCLNEYQDNKNNAKVYYNRAIGKSPEMEVSKQMAKIIKPLIKENEKVLDVGCASGHFYRSLKNTINKRFHYLGMDPYEIFLKNAKKAWKNETNVSFVRGDIYKIPLKNKTHEISFCSNVFLHLNDIEKPLREIFRVSKKYVIIRTVLYDVSYRIQLVYNKKWWPGVDVKPVDEFDKFGNPRAYSFFNIHSKDYFSSIIKKINKKYEIKIIKDNFFSKKNITRSIKKEKRPLATRIIGNEQFSGCIMQPHYFVIIKLSN